MNLTANEYLQINQALFSLTHAYEARLAKEEPEKRAGLTLYDCAILMVLGQSAPVTSHVLADRMQVARSTVSVYIRRLSQKGLVEMVQTQGDRRLWSLHLTEQGKVVYRAIVAGTVRYTRDFISALGPEDQRRLHRLLLKVSHSLGFTWQ